MNRMYFGVLHASLAKVKRWKQEAKVGVKKIELAKKERDEAKQEAMAARLVAVAKDEAKVRVEDDLTRVRDALGL